MNPLKQGLKPTYVEAVYWKLNRVFIHESIKTRVETASLLDVYREAGLSLSMNPLKQGLKRQSLRQCRVRPAVFIHESIKTRVETATAQM